MNVTNNINRTTMTTVGSNLLSTIYEALERYKYSPWLYIQRYQYIIKKQNKSKILYKLGQNRTINLSNININTTTIGDSSTEIW